MLDSLQNREKVFSSFPKLASDKKFNITSKEDPNYNCIAWAGKRNDINWWPVEKKIQCLDGISWDWPFGYTKDSTLKSFILVFEKLGFKCEAVNADYEVGFIKVALYVKESDFLNSSLNLMDMECTHASRQSIQTKLWLCKLGRSFDISHSSPYEMEGEQYGKVAIILKQEFR